MWRPAWRIIHTGGRGTDSPLAALRRIDGDGDGDSDGDSDSNGDSDGVGEEGIVRGCVVKHSAGCDNATNTAALRMYSLICSRTREVFKRGV
jgi:hypothetical protein